jgi:two-component sensor histidine kinase
MKIKHQILFLLPWFFSGALVSQTLPEPSARFTFNFGRNYDEISNRPVKLVNTSFTEDRFGNENCAVYVNGNYGSYVNLGDNPELKPRAGSISLWARMEGEIWAGTGYTVNPIILTKNSESDDFYEAYAIVYSPETKRLDAGASKDISSQASITPLKKFSLFRWHHLLYTYDDDEITLYVDGNFEGSTHKGFQTVFNPKDSVLLGITGNKKNKRCSRVIVDDIQFFNKVLNAHEVNELYNAPNPNKNQVFLNWLLAIFSGVVILSLVYLMIRFQITKAHKKEKENLQLANTMLETELRVNRALMNPHFIFNSLNALHDLILSKQLDVASDYLVKFSKLIRKTLESNTSGTLSLETEVEILGKYLEIESMRFDKKIKYTVNIDPHLIPSATRIPIMLLQPFVENAIWHGLLNKEGDREIMVSFSPYEKKYLLCRIEDNGTGRKEKTLKSEKKSLATTFVLQRLELLNKMYNLECSLQITDKPGQTGVIVTILLPVLNN